MDLFAFEEYLYYIFVILVCLFIFSVVVAFWLINYIKSSILPRPRLKVRLYLNYSLKALIGVIKAVVPCFSIMLCFYYGLNYITTLKKVTGDYDDDYPISMTYTADSIRITKYLDGRLGISIFIFS